MLIFTHLPQINSAITSAEDLKGRAVASTAIYLPRLRLRYGIVATDEKVQGDDTLEAIAANVVNGQFAAFIWYGWRCAYLQGIDGGCCGHRGGHAFFYRDEPVLRNLAANWPTCNINILPETIEPFDLGARQYDSYHVYQPDTLF